MFPRGIGVVALSIGGAIPHGNSMIYSVLEIAILVVGLVWYYYNCRTYPEVGLVLAVLPFFFAWRSYSIYMSIAGVLVFASVLTTHGRSIRRGPSPDTIKGMTQKKLGALRLVLFRRFSYDNGDWLCRWILRSTTETICLRWIYAKIACLLYPARCVRMEW